MSKHLHHSMDELKMKHAGLAEQVRSTINLDMPHYLRPKQAASYFGIGVSTLWQWLKTRPGFPPAIKAGPRTTLIDIPATAAYIESASEIQQ